ncbi:MAG: FISUMP domain-containing protein, partial [Bacteroidota bacterium]
MLFNQHYAVRRKAPGMMLILFVSLLILVVFSIPAIAQVAINTDNTPPSNSAMLDVKSTTKGFLPPWMTTDQRNAITPPEDGLFIFNITTGCIDYYLGGSWKSLCGGSSPAFQCGMKMTDTRDGKMYNTVKIGSQCWMAQELNYGTRIPHTTAMSDNSIPEKYCYDDLETNCDVYGGIYQWNELMQYLNTPGGQGLCPTGWHIPTDAEWCQMEVYVDPTVDCTLDGTWTGTDIAAKLKEAGTQHWAIPNTGAINSSGFTALPGGWLCPDPSFCAGNFLYLSTDAFYWTSSEDTQEE